jgi:IS30 family transposase
VCMKKGYQHLGPEERERINLYRAEGKSLREIGRLLDRSDATIGRELRRNAAPVQKVRYLAHKAQERYQERQSQAHSRPRLKTEAIRIAVTEMLKERLSPELIAGRLPLDHKGASISHEAIYQWIYREARGHIPDLTYAHKRRKRKGQGKRHKTSHIPNRTGIEERPKSVEKRKEMGHWEADTAVSQQSLAALNVVVERKTRYTCLEKVERKTAEACSKAIRKALRKWPEDWTQSVTYDNGSENVMHESVNQAVGTVSYFCRPYHSWEKGTVENTIGIIRRLWPKKTDFASLSINDINLMETWLNNRPRKCLGFRTPIEACLDECCT